MQQVAAGSDDVPQWMVDTTYAEALNGIGRHDEAIALLRPHLNARDAGEWRQGMIATVLADALLGVGRPAEALPLYGEVIAMFGEGVASQAGQMVQASTAVLALARLGRLDDAATGLGVCELVHSELAWPSPGLLAGELATARDLLDEEQIAKGQRQARALGVTGGLAWVGKVARGEPV
jgi:hypothetical protein